MNTLIGVAIGAIGATVAWYLLVIYAITHQLPWQRAFWLGSPNTDKEQKP
jgi:hypothetical protein